MIAYNLAKSCQTSMNDRHPKIDRLMPEMFVGGLPSHVTEADIRSIFSIFGKIVSVRMMNYRDGRSRGFAFIRFNNLRSYSQVMDRSPICYQGKDIECKMALTKEQSKCHIEQTTAKKIYVGNVSKFLHEEDLKDYFEQFGPLEKVKIATTACNNLPRGFGFVAFKYEESVRSVLRYSLPHIIKGSTVKCRPAVSKSETENLKYEVADQMEMVTEKKLTDQKSKIHTEQNLVFHCRTVKGHPYSRRHIQKLQWKDTNSQEVNNIDSRTSKKQPYGYMIPPSWRTTMVHSRADIAW